MDKPNYDLEHRHTIEEGILGAFLIDSSHEIETLAKKHNLLPSDFRSLHHKALYTAILATWEQGVNVDLITISNHRPVEFRTNEIGGMAKDWDYSNVIISQKVSSSTHVEHHIMQLKQYVIAEYWNNVSDAIQCINWNTVDTIEVSDNIVNRFNDLFKRMTIGIKSHHGEMSYEEEMTKKILNNRAGISSNISTGSDEIDELFKGGMSNSELIILAGRPGMLKGLPLNEIVITPDGYKTIKDINIGDEICNTYGSVSKVVGVSNQKNRPIYEITFDDGLKIEADDQHLWEVQNRAIRKKKGNEDVLVLSTKELIEQGLYRERGKRKNFSIKYPDPVYHQEKEILIDPYILGCLIGDGYIGMKSSIQFSNSEKDIQNKFIDYFGNKITINKVNHRIRKCSLYEDLKHYNLLGTLSHTKFIPKNYLYNSIENRLKILHGLMDTDGTINDSKVRNSIIYTTTSKQLAKDIKLLVNGLGGRCTLSDIKKGRYLKDNEYHYVKDYWVLNISFDSNIIPVSSKKHLSKYVNKKQFHKRFITSIEYVKKGKTKCLLVDSKDQCFLTKNYLVTHNTTIALIIAWNSSKKGNKVVFFSLEMPTNQLKNKIISLETGINYFDLKNGNLTDKEWAAVVHWNEYIDNSNLTIISDIKHIDQIADKLRELSINGLCDFAVFDYLQLIYWPGTVIREGIVYITRLMKSLAKECYIPIMLLSQLNRSVESRVNKRPFLSDLKESGSIEEDADIVIFPFNEAYYALNQDPPQQIAESELWKVEFNIAKGRDIGRSANTELTINPIKLTIESYNPVFL